MHFGVFAIMPFEGITERQVTTELENGDGSHVSALFSGKFQEERMASLRVMQELYEQDVKAGRTKTDLTFSAEAYYNPSIQILSNGRQLYGDALDLYKLEHTDPNDKVPPNRKPFDMAEIRRVTTDLENGSADSFKSSQDGRFMEERVRFMKAIGELNGADVANKTAGATLGFQFSGHKWFGNQMAVNYYAPGGLFSSNFWTNPRRLYSETLDMKSGQRQVNVYHPEK